MKTKLLKKCRKQVKLFERNGKYYVHNGKKVVSVQISKQKAYGTYQFYLLNTANDIYGFKPKRQIH